MNAAAYLLARSLLDAPGLPLPHRASWAAWLAQVEPHPADVQRAAHELHLSGHFVQGRLTPDGERAALEALHLALTRPGKPTKARASFSGVHHA